MPIVPATPDAIVAAARELQAGRLVAFPTETVYGLGADATNGPAVAAVYAAKGRPSFNPLIIHVAEPAAVAALAVADRRARMLAEQFWPGPLTVVLPRRPDCPVSELATVGLDTIAVRVPANETALALLRAAGVPVAAPSANRSGHVSPTTAAHVEADLGAAVAMIVDGGPCPIGVESTVLDLASDQPRLLRAGGVASEAIEAVLGQALVRQLEAGTRPASPGQLASHYAPRAQVRMNVTAPVPGEALLAFGPDLPDYDGRMINLSPSESLAEAAAALFAALRALDATGVESIAVMPIPSTGLGEAINDRLRRAAAAR